MQEIQQASAAGEVSQHSFGAPSGTPASTPENSSASFGNDDIWNLAPEECQLDQNLLRCGQWFSVNGSKLRGILG
jgi:hypothetical protein